MVELRLYERSFIINLPFKHLSYKRRQCNLLVQQVSAIRKLEVVVKLSLVLVLEVSCDERIVAQIFFHLELTLSDILLQLLIIFNEPLEELIVGVFPMC